MFELHQAAGNSYYIESPAAIGLIRLAGQEVCLIDSGSDKDAGRKVRQLLDAQGWRLSAIYNTHSNADHIGGNRYLQQQTGCRIYAPGIERDLTVHPLLEPSFLYGGYPPRELRHKFLMAQESAAEPLTPQALPEGVAAVPLPGHFFDMTGYRTADGVVYLADCLASRETLEKYRIAFLYDAAAYLDTLRRVLSMEAALFVPAHAAPAAQVAELAQYNIDRVYATADDIARLCRDGLDADGVLKALFDAYGLSLNFEQYVLIGSTVRSYLVWMREQGRLEAVFEDNRLLWKTTAE